MLSQEQILERLMRIVEEISAQMYVVTDGLRVSAIILDKKIAEFLCKEMRKKYNTDAWVYLSIPEAIEYSFTSGRECAFEELRLAQSKAEQPVDDSANGEVNGKDQELRESNL